MKNGQQVVAVVENDPAMLKAFERLLRATGFRSVLYESAEAYLERAQAEPVGCLILDIDLGGLSGIELQQQLVEEGAAPPIIFVTSQVDASYRERAQSLGCVAYLRKPFQAPELLEALART